MEIYTDNWLPFHQSKQSIRDQSTCICRPNISSWHQVRVHYIMNNTENHGLWIFIFVYSFVDDLRQLYTSIMDEDQAKKDRRSNEFDEKHSYEPDETFDENMGRLMTKIIVAWANELLFVFLPIEYY